MRGGVEWWTYRVTQSIGDKLMVLLYNNVFNLIYYSTRLQNSSPIFGDETRGGAAKRVFIFCRETSFFFPPRNELPRNELKLVAKSTIPACICKKIFLCRRIEKIKGKIKMGQARRRRDRKSEQNFDMTVVQLMMIPLEFSAKEHKMILI